MIQYDSDDSCMHFGLPFHVWVEELDGIGHWVDVGGQGHVECMHTHV